MATRIIKLQNDSYTLLPVTDAKLVQMTVDGNTKSVYDVILEDEEVTAAGYNELDDRVETLETAGYITNAALSSYVKGLNSTAGTGVVTGAALENNSSGGKNIKLTYTNLSTSDPSASGNSTTFIATISQAANGKITATKKTIDLSSQSKDFGYVQSLTGDSGTGGGTSNTNKLCADAVKDTLQVKGGNKWITTGVSQNDTSETSNTDILYINHAINPDGSNKTVTTSGNSSLTHNSSLVITGISYNVDVAGHIKSITATTGKLPAEQTIPNGFANVKTDIDETDITENTTKGTVAADTTTDTVTLRGGNKWITTGVNTTDDIAYINHKPKWTADGSITANASGATAAWSIDVIKGITLSYDAAGHITGLTYTSGKIPENPNSDTKVTQSQCSTAGNYPVLFKHSANTTAETNTVNFDHLSTEGGSRSSFYFNPSTDKLFVDNLKVNYDLIVSSSNDENGGEPNTYTHITSDQVHAPSLKGMYEYSDESPRRDYTGDYIDDNITVDDDITDIFIRLGEPDISGAHITTDAPSGTSTDETWPTSKAVNDAISGALTSVLKYKGTIGTGGTVTSLPASHSVGDVYVVKTAGTYAGQACEPGDYILCYTKGTSANDAHWDIVTGENQYTLTESNTLPANGTTISPLTIEGKTLTIGHGAPTAAAGSKLSKDASGGAALAANTALQVVTGVDISRDANGHVTALDLDSKSITIPNGFANVIAGTDVTDNVDGTTTKTNAAADTTTDTLTVIGGNKWITTGSTDTSNADKLFINHKRWKTSDGSIVANASGATAAWSIDVVKGVTLSYDAAGHVGGLTVTSGKIPDPASTLYWANMNVQTAANYIKEPEFKTVKINGSTTNAASTNNCVLQYDTTNKCLNFVFN